LTNFTFENWTGFQMDFLHPDFFSSDFKWCLKTRPLDIRTHSRDLNT
jgi:hypothetical protein